MTNPLAEATAGVLEILSALSPEDRSRVVRATLTLLGDELPSANRKTLPAQENEEESDLEAPPQVKIWAKKHGLTSEQLEQHFHFDQGKVVAISLPGSTKKKIEQVENTYLMQGLSAFLATGDSSFSDDDARSLCEHFGCYDSSNHSKYMKFGNRITGSKSGGWKLTAPGLTAAAELLKHSSD